MDAASSAVSHENSSSPFLDFWLFVEVGRRTVRASAIARSAPSPRQHRRGRPSASLVRFTPRIAPRFPLRRAPDPCGPGYRRPPSQTIWSVVGRPLAFQGCAVLQRAPRGAPRGPGSRMAHRLRWAPFSSQRACRSRLGCHLRWLREQRHLRPGACGLRRRRPRRSRLCDGAGPLADRLRSERLWRLGCRRELGPGQLRCRRPVHHERPAHLPAAPRLHWRVHGDVLPLFGRPLHVPHVAVRMRSVRTAPTPCCSPGCRAPRGARAVPLCLQQLRLGHSGRPSFLAQPLRRHRKVIDQEFKTSI